MIVKELSNLFDVSDDTIKRAIKELYPNLIQNGKRTILSKDQAICVGEIVRKKGYIEPTQNAQVPTQNAQVEEYKKLVLEKDDIILNDTIDNLGRNVK